METQANEKPNFDRTFFIVDRSKLKEETDELRNAIAVYMPETDLKRQSLEQRCSQLIGISLLITNFTGSLPKFIRLKSNGFAIRQLGVNFIMGLQSKMDEPKSCVIQYLDCIHDFFNFYYCSPENVMQMALVDWEIFTIQMTAIFTCILDFTFRETHSLPTMFNPLPYVSLDSDRGGTHLYMQAQRVLRNCQLHEPVIAGCLFYNGELLCSQLPPEFAEKLLLVASGGVELNSRSVLEDLIAPESVWVINVYLTPEELALTHHLRRHSREILSMYSSLKPDPNLTSTIVLDRKVQSEKIEKSTSTKQKKVLAPSETVHGKDSHMPLHRRGSTDSDFVTISYGSESVAFTRKALVSPLKRPKVDGRRSLIDDSIESIDQILAAKRNRYDPLPPLPSYKGEESEIPPPIPPRKGDKLPPPIPQRKFISPPQPPPRTSSTAVRNFQKESDTEQPPPPLPPRKHEGPKKQPNISISDNMPPPSSENECDGATWIYGEIKDTDDDSPVSPAVYGTPPSSLGFGDLVDNNPVIQVQKEDSDQSEGYQTPPGPSPLPDKDVSFSTTSDTSVVLSHSQSFFTPLGMSTREGSSNSSLTSSNKTTAPHKGLTPIESNEEDLKGVSPERNPIIPNGHIDGLEILPEFKEDSTPVISESNSLKISPHNDDGLGGLDETDSPRKKIEEIQVERRKGVVGEHPLVTKEENHYEVEHSKSLGSLLSVDQSDGHTEIERKDSTERKISTVSNSSSLVITKALSEYGSTSSFSLDSTVDLTCGDELKVVSTPHLSSHTPSSIVTHSLSEDARDIDDCSPVSNELTESTSEDDHVTDVKGAMFAQSMKRPRADTWMIMNPEKRSIEKLVHHPNNGGVQKKCLYIQKCVNTVTAILADEDLPNNHHLIKALWKTMITQLLQINNEVESCLQDQESIYSPGESSKTDQVSKTYQAGYSNTIRICEVSSVTAPYHFRHAVRRVHQEYSNNPSLKQVSLCKEYCRLISQNILGRESYFHTTRVIASDSLGTHSALERHAKSIKKQRLMMQYPVDGFTVSFL